MQSSVDSRDRNRSGIHDCLVMSDRVRMDENAANNGQPTDNTRVMVNERNCTPLQVQKTMRSGHSRPGKRPIKNVSPAEKIDAIDRVHDGESKASVARDIGIPESTLRGWCKSEQKIRSQCNNMSTDMINRHCSININNSRSTSGRHLVNIWDSSNNQQSSDTSSCDNGPPAKRAKVERTNRQSSSQTVMPGPSTSSTSEAYINPNYVSLVASTMNSMPTMSLHEQHQMCRLITTLKDVLLQRNNSVALVEDRLNCTKTSNTPSSTITSNSAAINNIANNIREIERIQTAMKNVFGNTMGNAFNYTVGNNRNIAVAPIQGTSSSYTRKSPSVKPAAEAPTTPAPASPHENIHSREADHTTGDNTNISGNASWMHLAQQIASAQQLRGHCLADVSNIINSRKNWYWDKSPAKSQLTAENMLTYLNYWANNNNFGNVVSDDNSENRTHSRSVASEVSDSREEHENLPSQATPERATLPTPPTMGPTLTPGVMKELQAAKTDPSNSDIDQAIRYSTWLQEWFKKCSIPLLTDSQVLHHKRITQILESAKHQPKTQKKVESEITARPTHANLL